MCVSVRLSVLVIVSTEAAVMFLYRVVVVVPPESVGMNRVLVLVLEAVELHIDPVVHIVIVVHSRLVGRDIGLEVDRRKQHIGLVGLHIADSLVHSLGFGRHSLQVNDDATNIFVTQYCRQSQRR